MAWGCLLGSPSPLGVEVSDLIMAPFLFAHSSCGSWCHKCTKWDRQTYAHTIPAPKGYRVRRGRLQEERGRAAGAAGRGLPGVPSGGAQRHRFASPQPSDFESRPVKADSLLCCLRVAGRGMTLPRIHAHARATKAAKIKRTSKSRHRQL
jgi:hypothetical protein